MEVVRGQWLRAPYDRWYVIRAERYLKAYPGTTFSRHRPEEVSAYLEEIGRKDGLKDRQFHQVVEDLETLFCKVVWRPRRAGSTGDWKDSAHSLEPHHAAREVPLARGSGGHDRTDADLGPAQERTDR